jgi:uncharacterized LabA/DUF88 family protein
VGTYAFIDSQNLNLGVRSLGWTLDYRKFRQYLRGKYGVERAYLFIGYVESNSSMYEQLEGYGYKIIFKPTMALPDGTVKGNVDAELVLHAMIQIKNYDRAVIVSGDGDFFCLAEYLDDNRKLERIIVPNRAYSKLLSAYRRKLTSVDALRASLEYIKKSRNSGRSKP